MRLRRLSFAVIAWLAVTTGATALSWAGASLVMNEVTNEHTFLSPSEIQALVRPAPSPSSTPVIVAAEQPQQVVPEPNEPQAPRVLAKSATFRTMGGVASVSCTDSVINLLSASPGDGFQLTVRSAGPTIVDVLFTRDLYRSSIVADCQSGEPRRFDYDRRRGDDRHYRDPERDFHRR